MLYALIKLMNARESFAPAYVPALVIGGKEFCNRGKVLQQLFATVLQQLFALPNHFVRFSHSRKEHMLRAPTPTATPRSIRMPSPLSSHANAPSRHHLVASQRLRQPKASTKAYRKPMPPTITRAAAYGGGTKM